MNDLQRLSFAALLVLSTAAFSVNAQDEPAPAPARQGPARGMRGAAGTREFLGLGAAPDQAAANKGAGLYKQNCGGCHGDNARGGQAPNLVRSVVVLHDEKDEEIGPVIKAGRPQAGMPAFPQLSSDEIHNLSQFLKLQIELAANRGTYGQTYAGLKSQLSGDPKRGEAYFNANCASCHSPAGDLAKVGAKYAQVTQMQAKFLWPAPQGPAKATVTTGSGQSVSGTVRHLDDFGISLIDATGEYHYWPATQVKIEVEDKLGGHRSLLPRYTDADIHDLTAYLVTLK